MTQAQQQTQTAQQSANGHNPNVKLPAKSGIEILDSIPVEMRRPLALIDGESYAATWLPTVEYISSEEIGGQMITYDPPKEAFGIELFVVSRDGKLYGPGQRPMKELGIEVHLPETPPASKLWSPKAVKLYCAGSRPNLVDVFNRVVSVIDKFIAFDRSLAEQHVMAEFVACYVLSTWMLDAFTVIGFLWPNAERGSGKTQLLNAVAEMSYLGQVILSGGSYATLRDLADYGATLAFDDIENIKDKRFDPDKKALLLAGNRRGATVTVKELGGDNRWHTRHVNAFCPRLFSAISLPDSVLASRSIIVPLVRTADKGKANSDVLRYKAWPCDRQKLVDDLWSLALCHLPELPAYEEKIDNESTLVGRNLEPWRAILAIAKWLDDKGITSLLERMVKLSQDYQTERQELELSDLTTLTLRALVKVLCTSLNVPHVPLEPQVPLTERHLCFFAVGDVYADIIAICQDEDTDSGWITSDKVGRRLAKLRLKQTPRSGGQGSRKWTITTKELCATLDAYSIPHPFIIDTLESSGTSGTSGTCGTADDLTDGEI